MTEGEIVEELVVLITDIAIRKFPSGDEYQCVEAEDKQGAKFRISIKDTGLWLPSAEKGAIYAFWSTDSHQGKRGMTAGRGNGRQWVFTNSHVEMKRLAEPQEQKGDPFETQSRAMISGYFQIHKWTLEEKPADLNLSDSEIRNIATTMFIQASQQGTLPTPALQVTWPERWVKEEPKPQPAQPPEPKPVPQSDRNQVGPATKEDLDWESVLTLVRSKMWKEASKIWRALGFTDMQALGAICLRVSEEEHKKVTKLADRVKEKFPEKDSDSEGRAEIVFMNIHKALAPPVHE